MFGAGEDVNAEGANPDVQTNVAEPSTAEGQKTEGEEPKAPVTDPSAGTQKAEETVPFAEHPRWKEVMGERNTAREELDKLKTEMATNAQSTEVYRQFDTLLTQHPELYSDVEKLFTDFMGRQGQEGQPATGAQDPQAINPMVQNLQKQVTNMQFEGIRNSYQKDFDEATKDLPPEAKAVYEKLTEVEMYRVMNEKGSAPYQSYVPNLVGESFKTVQEGVSKMLGADRQAHITDKVSDNVPTAPGSSQPAVTDNRPKTQQGRAEYLASAMKNAK